MRGRTAVVSALVVLSVSLAPPSLAAARSPDVRSDGSPPPTPAVPRAAARLSANAPQVYGPSAGLSIPDGAGGLYITWADVRDGSGDIFLQRVTSSGAVAAGWPADGLAVCNAVGDQFESVMVPDGSNGVIVGWLDYRDSWKTPDGYVQRVNSAGVPLWTANGVKAQGNLPVEETVIAPDGTGGLLVAWSGAGAVDKDLFALRINGAGALAPGWSPTGTLVCGLAEDQLSPAVTGDGSGGAIVAWEDGRAGGGETHVYAQRLNASGAAQWAANGILLDASALSAASPVMCSDGGTGALVFWTDFSSVEPIVGQKVTSAGAAAWTAGGLGVGGSASLQGFVEVVADGLGGAVVTWEESPAAVPGLRAQRVDGSGAAQWGASGVEVVGIANSSPQLYDVIPDGAGAAYFLWEDNRSFVTAHATPDIFAQRVSATGALWAADGVAVCTAPGEQYAPTGAIDGGSLGLVVAWRDQRAFDTDLYAQHYTSAGAAQLAADGVAVFTNPGVQVGSAVVQTGDGGAVVFFNEKRNGQWDIRARKMNATGTPAATAVPICIASGQQILAAAIDDGAGGAIVAWTDRRSGSEDLYAQRVDANGTPQWTANGVAICTASGMRTSVGMVTDGAGGAILAWQDERSFNSDIYAQRVNSLGAVQWTANGVAVCSEASGQKGAVIAPDGASGAIVAWSDFRSFLAPAVYAQRLNGAGTPQWAANGLSIASFSLATYPRVTGAAPGAVGEAVVLISQPVVDLVTFDITTILVAQKVNGAGAAQWGPAGATVCDASSECLRERIVEDGSGGAYVAWSDGRNATFDVFMQRLDATGAAQWAANGVAVCGASGWQHLDGLTRDPAGDEYLTWEDQRDGQPDIYAQRVNPAGSAQWAADGVRVCGFARGQFYSGLAPYRTAAPARLYVTWTDNRAATERTVFLQRLDLAGAAQWAADGVTRTALSMVSASAGAGVVRLVWLASDPLVATVERSAGAEDWRPVGEVAADGGGRIAFEDRDVVPGQRYGYRLAYRDAGQRTISAETWVEVPGDLEFALEGLRPNPAVSALVVAFSLPARDAVTLELLDVAGRRVMVREFEGLEPGRHVLRLDGARPRAGMYFVRLSQRGRTLTARAAVLD